MTGPRVTLGLVALVVALSGCVRSEVDLSVDRQGRVSGSVVVAVREELVDIGGRAVEDFTAGLIERDGGPPDGTFGLPLRLAEADSYSREGMVGARFRFEEVDAGEFRQPDGGSSRLFTEQEDGSWRFEANILEAAPFVDFDQVSGLDLRGEMNVRVTFPYAVETHNGALQSPNVVTWQLELSERVPTLLATTGTELADTGGDGGLPWQAVVIGAGTAVALIALGAVWWRSSRRRPAPG